MMKYTFTLMFSFLLLMFFNTTSQAQAGCCVALNFDNFQTYCIGNLDPCTVDGTCTGAALDAAHGITGSWGARQCNTPADCSAQGCGNLVLLSVELVDFDVNYLSNVVELYWSTVSETNNEGFEVQKSIDGKNWTELGFIDGNGSTNQFHDYKFTDKTPNIGLNYYRLKQMDYDEKYEYSSVKVIVWQGSNDRSKLQLAVMPNPASEWITAALPHQLRGKNLQFDIFDQVGKLVRSEIIDIDSEIRISLDGLQNGFYILRASDGQVEYATRFIKN